MINFTDDRLYAKGTCNVILSDVNTGDIYYQSDKMSTGNFTTSVNLNEIRAGLGNPIAAMIPSDSQLQVDFDAADFSLWAKSAQLGATFGYSAPVPMCQTVKATTSTLTIDVSLGAPVAQLGQKTPVCYVQEVGASSLMATDGTAYEVDAATGDIDGFTATATKTYKVWYYVQKVSAQLATISSFIDPKVVRLEAQIAVYSNRGGNALSNGTRVGWLYVVIPFLKMQGDATITGDQTNADTTKISGQAIAYDKDFVSDTCSDCDSSTFGYLIYSPDDAAKSIMGLAVIGGVVTVTESETAQIPVKIVMIDGSLVTPSDYATGFSYTLSGAPTGTTVSTAGVISAGSTAGDCECEIEYTVGTDTYETVTNVSVVSA